MLTPARGTKCFLGEKMRQRNHLKELLVEWAKDNNFSEIELPTFEYSELFVGNKDQKESILEKEIFYLERKKYALKPEGTISAAREVVNQKLLFKNSSPLKFFYISQCFRYERPQKGRYREFTQFGIEIINASSLIYEIELIFSMNQFLNEKLSLNTTLKINYLASSEIKKQWSKDLTNYFSKNSEKLSETSKERINNNPIRILDDKIDSHLKVVKDAPKIHSYLSQEEIEKILNLKKYLKSLNINYIWDENLVRGLDYYTGIVFEWEINGLTIAGGGRYDELFNRFSKEKNKKLIPSLGLALGLDRLHLVLNEHNYKWPGVKQKKIYLCYLIAGIETRILFLIQRLKNSNIKIEANWEIQDLNSHFKYSEKKNIKWLLIYGDKESKNNEIILKEQNKSYQISFSLNNLNGLIMEIRKLVEFEN